MTCTFVEHIDLGVVLPDLVPQLWVMRRESTSLLYHLLFNHSANQSYDCLSCLEPNRPSSVVWRSCLEMAMTCLPRGNKPSKSAGKGY